MFKSIVVLSLAASALGASVTERVYIPNGNTSHVLCQRFDAACKLDGAKVYPNGISVAHCFKSGKDEATVSCLAKNSAALHAHEKLITHAVVKSLGLKRVKPTTSKTSTHHATSSSSVHHSSVTTHAATSHTSAPHKTTTSSHASVHKILPTPLVKRIILEEDIILAVQPNATHHKRAEAIILVAATSTSSHTSAHPTTTHKTTESAKSTHSSHSHHHSHHSHSVHHSHSHHAVSHKSATGSPKPTSTSAASHTTVKTSSATHTTVKGTKTTASSAAVATHSGTVKRVVKNIPNICIKFVAECKLEGAASAAKGHISFCKPDGADKTKVACVGKDFASKSAPEIQLTDAVVKALGLVVV